MEALSPAINPALILPPRTTRSNHASLSFGSCRNSGSTRARVWRRFEVKAQAGKHVDTDFGDPDWKAKYQQDFESRFRIPHITDVLPDAVSYPSTFCLRMRTPVSPDFAEGYPSDEEWHGYINNNDRVLLKVIHYSSPTSAGAECIDPDCSWVEQCVGRVGRRRRTVTSWTTI